MSTASTHSIPLQNSPSLVLVNFNTNQGLGGATGQIRGIAFDANGNLNVGIEELGSDTSFIETWDFANQSLLGINPQGALQMQNLIAGPVVPEPNSAVLCLGIAGWLGIFGATPFQLANHTEFAPVKRRAQKRCRRN